MTSFIGTFPYPLLNSNDYTPVYVENIVTRNTLAPVWSLCNNGIFSLSSHYGSYDLHQNFIISGQDTVLQNDSSQYAGQHHRDFIHHLPRQALHAIPGTVGTNGQPSLLISNERSGSDHRDATDDNSQETSSSTANLSASPNASEANNEDNAGASVIDPWPHICDHPAKFQVVTYIHLACGHRFAELGCGHKLAQFRCGHKFHCPDDCMQNFFFSHHCSSPRLPVTPRLAVPDNCHLEVDLHPCDVYVNATFACGHNSLLPCELLTPIQQITQEEMPQSFNFHEFSRFRHDTT